MKISIVMPVYNGEKYIKKSIESILFQTYPDFELIVMDGLSTDRTVEIVNSFQDDRIRLISEKDEGQADAINKGFEYTNGDILAWQNADDLYFEDTFKTIADFFQNNKYDLVYGFYQMIDEKDRWICDVFPRQWNKWFFVHGRFCPVQPTVFWRKEVWEKSKPLKKELFFCMDVDFYSRIVNKFACYRIPQMLGKFRVHEESKTQNVQNVQKHKKEYKKVLSTQFNYGFADFALFEFFYYRSQMASLVKRNWLKKM